MHYLFDSLKLYNLYHLSVSTLNIAHFHYSELVTIYNVILYCAVCRHKHVAKLPVTFAPQRPKQDYHGILTIRTSAGHQLLAELKGSST